MKVLVIGGGSGIGKYVVDYFSPDSFNASRTTGYDIRKKEDVERISELSLEYDVVLNHAYTGDMSQYRMLYRLYQVWEKANKRGYIFHTGTYSTYSMQWNVDSDYPDLKMACDELCRKISKRCENNKVPFRCTNIRPGMLDTEKSRKKPHWAGNGIRGEQFAQLIDYFYNLPDDLCIPQIVLEARKDA